VDCYSFNVTDSHRLFLAGLTGAPSLKVKMTLTNDIHKRANLNTLE